MKTFIIALFSGFIFLISLLFPEQHNDGELVNALEGWQKNGGDLRDAIKKYDEMEISSRKSAITICNAIASLDLNKKKEGYGTPDLIHLVSLFENVKNTDCSAYNYLNKNGIKLIIQIYDKLIAEGKKDRANELLTILKIGIMYDSRDLYDRLLVACKNKSLYDSYVWHRIFPYLLYNHTFRNDFLKNIEQNPPPDPIALAIVSTANEMLLEQQIKIHPFDNINGYTVFERWLKSDNPDYSSHAYKAAVACAFFQMRTRDQLLKLAYTHKNMDVRLEGAWAAVKTGNNNGLKVLQDACLNVNYSRTARRYLCELGKEKAIPEKALKGEFMAKAEFAAWLAHPNELAQYPDELTILDRKKIKWPPEWNEKEFWLIQYTLKDKTGLEADNVDAAVIGNITFCQFGYDLYRRPPEDAYAIHCIWELEANKIKKVDAKKGHDYSDFISQWKGDKLKNIDVKQLFLIDKSLKYPQKQVAVATATKGNEEGFVVFDGCRSTWYPKCEHPKDESPHVVLMLHIGRQLLGFKGPVNRKKYLSNKVQKPSPKEYIQAYQKHIKDLGTVKTESQKEEKIELLGEHLEQYSKYRCPEDKLASSQVIADTFELLEKAINSSSDKVKKEQYRSYGALGENLEKYVASLVKLKRQDEVKQLLKRFEPYLKYNYEYGLFGKLAFNIKDYDTAEYYLLKLKKKDYWFNNDNIIILAEIWQQKGREKDAITFFKELFTCVAAHAKKSEKSDRKYIKERYDKYLKQFHRIFANQSDRILKQEQIANQI